MVNTRWRDGARRTLRGVPPCLTALLATASQAQAQDLMEIDKLTAVDGAPGDLFGSAVSISGDLALVGAPLGFDPGSVYVFRRQPDGSWLEVAQLAASDGAVEDHFGVSVSLWAGRALVGAELAGGTGAAYLYEQQPGGSWIEVQKLSAGDGAVDDLFGAAVAIEGEFALVGAQEDDDLGDRSGSAYAFERQPDGRWTEVHKLTASDGGGADFFGCAVSIADERALIGAFGFSSSGAAYVFDRQPDGTWTEAAGLYPSQAAFGADFGSSVSIAGGRAVVGAPDEHIGGSLAGSARIFERQPDGTWAEVQMLTGSDGTPGDQFGISVSISGDRALVGSQRHEGAFPLAGAAYLFGRQADGTWTELQKLTAGDPALADYFGAAVATGALAPCAGALATSAGARCWRPPWLGTPCAAGVPAVGGSCSTACAQLRVHAATLASLPSIFVPLCGKGVRSFTLLASAMHPGVGNWMKLRVPSWWTRQSASHRVMRHRPSGGEPSLSAMCATGCTPCDAVPGCSASRMSTNEIFSLTLTLDTSPFRSETLEDLENGEGRVR